MEQIDALERLIDSCQSWEKQEHAPYPTMKSKLSNERRVVYRSHTTVAGEGINVAATLTTRGHLLKRYEATIAFSMNHHPVDKVSGAATEEGADSIVALTQRIAERYDTQQRQAYTTRLNELRTLAQNELRRRNEQ